MKRSTSRWTTAIAAAALLGVPAATFAQTPAQTPTSQTPTTSSQPPTSTSQPPASTSGAQSSTPATEPGAQPPSAQPPATQVDAAAAKQALSDARDTLAQLASMPEAAKLQGEQRTQVSQLISNFNELITTQSNWKDAYGKVENSLNALIGPESGSTAEPGAAPSMAGTAGTTGTGSTAATGTSGSAPTPASGSPEASAASATSIDPALRAKLVEFRTHLKAFEQAAGGNVTTSSAPSSTAASAEPAAASTEPSSSTPNPTSAPETSASGTSASGTSAASPSMTSQSSQPATSAAASQGAVGTSGTTAPTATDARTVESQTQANRELDAIQAILAQAKNGRLNQTQIDQLKTHVTELRQLLGGSK